MSRALRHLPLLLLSAIVMLGVASCGDEPRDIRHGEHGRTDTTTTDTTHHHGNDSTGNDTTHHHGNDTMPAFAITLTAPRDYGYMGQTMQLAVTTSRPAEVTWHSSLTTAATVDQNGLVTFSNTTNDATTRIMVSAAGCSDSLLLTNRHWAVGAWIGNEWTRANYLTCRQGDTIALSIVDSQSRLIDDNGFNAAAVEWTATCYNADISTIVTAIDTPRQTNEWKALWRVNDKATPGAIITIIARHGEAASSIALTVAWN